MWGTNCGSINAGAMSLAAELHQLNFRRPYLRSRQATRLHATEAKGHIIQLQVTSSSHFILPLHQINSKMALHCLRMMLPFHAAAWKASSEPIQQLLDAASPQLQDEATTMWRDTMQTHLNYIGVTVLSNPVDVY